MPLLEGLTAVRDFLDLGGGVLRIVLAVTFLMWILILERLWYFRTIHPSRVREVAAAWQQRAERRSWYARQVRRALVSRVSEDLRHSLALIRTLVSICPLLGLLGTVTGMIEVFEVMALTGNSNPRALASGVARATVPTMAGMVAALSGLYLSVWMERFARDESARVADRLTLG